MLKALSIPAKISPFHREMTFAENRSGLFTQQVVGTGKECIGVIEGDPVGVCVGAVGVQTDLQGYIQTADDRLRRNTGQPVTGIVNGILGKAGIVEVMPGMADEQAKVIAEALWPVDKPIREKGFYAMLICAARVDRIADPCWRSIRWTIALLMWKMKASMSINSLPFKKLPLPPSS